MLRNILVTKKTNNKAKIDSSGQTALSGEQILKEIGNAVNKEKIKREKLQKQKEADVIRLSQDALVKRGEINYAGSMPHDIATLKALIQSVVRHELKRILKDQR